MTLCEILLTQDAHGCQSTEISTRRRLGLNGERSDHQGRVPPGHRVHATLCYVFFSFLLDAIERSRRDERTNSMLRNGASGLEIGLRARFRPDSNRESLQIGLPAGQMSAPRPILMFS